MKLLENLRAKRDETRAALESVYDGAAEEDRDLNDTEDENVAELRAELEKLDKRIESLSEFEIRNGAAAELNRRVEEAGGRQPAPVRVTSEESIYHERSKHSFFIDSYRSQYLADPWAAERLSRHMREVQVEERAADTTAFTGLVIPQHLVDLFAPKPREGRVTASLCRPAPLPASGMTVSVPRIITGTEVDSQATQNSQIASQDMESESVTADVVTVAGEQNVSRQSLERGESIDSIVYGDLVAAYAARLNAQVINGAGINGEHLGLLQVTGVEAIDWTEGTPDAEKFYSVLADAIQRINSNRLLPATAIVMHPRRWGWLTAQADTTGRPLVVPDAQVPTNATAVGESAALGRVGSMHGLPVYSDPSMPTQSDAATPADEDTVAVIRAADLLLFEENGGVPRQLRFEPGAGSLTVKLVAYGYSAFIGGRTPTSIAKITGTGLEAPTFG